MLEYPLSLNIDECYLLRHVLKYFVLIEFEIGEHILTWQLSDQNNYGVYN